MSDVNRDNSLHESEEENDSEEEEAEEQFEDDRELEESAMLEMERDFSIVAVPPKVLPHEEYHQDASSSPAFHILNAVSNLFIYDGVHWYLDYYRGSKLYWLSADQNTLISHTGSC